MEIREKFYLILSLMNVSFAPQFKRQFKKLVPALKEEAFEKIQLFEKIENHGALRVHKLHGSLSGKLSFWVNYRYRIVFMWEVQNKSAILLTIGDHALYD